MKKRILSFLLACFMVASTFIISKPIVHIYAVDNDADTYQLPMDWTSTGNFDGNGWELAEKGQWRLTNFGDPANIATMVNKASQAEIGSRGEGVYNEWTTWPFLASAANLSASALASGPWYVTLNYRDDGTIRPICAGDNSTYMWMNPLTPGRTDGGRATTNHPAAVFTAPKDGTYSYSELVTLNQFTVENESISVTVTVRKNGELVDAVTLTEGNPSKTLSGTVALKADDLLMFVVSLNSTFSEETLASSAYKVIREAKIVKLGETVVKRTGEYSEDTESSYALPMDWSATGTKDNNRWELAINGQWRLTNFGDPANIATMVNKASQAEIGSRGEGVYNEWTTWPFLASAANLSASALASGPWYVTLNYRDDGTIRPICAGDNSTYMWMNPLTPGRTDGGRAATNHPAAVFTAPQIGTYSYLEQVTLNQFTVENDSISVTATVRKNGEIIDTVELTSTNPSAFLSGSVELEAGDLLMFVVSLSSDLSEETLASSTYKDIRYAEIVKLGSTTVKRIDEDSEGEGSEDEDLDGALPMNWSSTEIFDKYGWELPVQGEWQLTSFGDPTDISTIVNKDSLKQIGNSDAGVYQTDSPWPYLESTHNRSETSGAAATPWYLNLTYRDDGNPHPIYAGNNKTYMYVNPALPSTNAETNNPAVVFTATEDGLYSYSELVTGTLFSIGNYPVSVTATVRKNGVLIDAFTPTVNNPSRTLTGTVSLKKGDLLMFVFTLNTEVAEGTNVPVKLGKTVVKKIGEYVEDTATGTKYVLPHNWAVGLNKDENGWDLAQKGYWKLVQFTNPAYSSMIVEFPSLTDISKAGNNARSVSPAPYIESQDNYFALFGETGNTDWFVSGVRRGEGGEAFASGDNLSYMKIKIQSDYAWSNHPTVLFTAPEDGLYSYSVLVSEAMFKDKDGNAVEGVATIRKNGRVINAFVPTASDAEDILTGTVELKKGDFFMISFNAINKGNTDPATHIFTLGDTVLTKIGSAYNGVEVDLSPIFDGTSLTDISGNVKLWSYDTGSGKLYDTTSKGNVRMELSEDGTIWYAYNPLGTNGGGGSAEKNYIWSGLVNGSINMVGGNLRTSNIGFALVFTAPYDGTFAVDADLQSIYINEFGGSYHDHTIMLGDGTVLVSTTNRGQKNYYTETISATVDLKKGETVIVLKTPNNASGIYNSSCNGEAKITIKEVNHVCKAETLTLIGAIDSGCDDGNVKHYACLCGLNYSDAEATDLLGTVVLPGEGHNTGAYEADQGKHWKHCSDCNTDLEVKAHTWAKGACTVCEYKCNHDWNGDNVCDNCGYDRTADLAQESFDNALDNYFNDKSNAVNPVGPTTSLDRFKVIRPSEKVTGLEYAQFNLRFENGIIIRHHFIVEGDNIDLYTFTVNGVKVTPTKTGAEVYYIETTAEAGKLHVPDTITVKKGNKSVDFSVSVYSYIAVALEKSDDSKLINVLKSLYDLNEALYTANGDRALLEITVESEAISKFVSDRYDDPDKENITLILVTGQSNFTRQAGYAWEFDHYYYYAKNPAPPVSPTLPNKGTVYSFYDDATEFVLNDASDMYYLSSPNNGTNCLGGVTPVFGARWYELTKTKVVFIQAAEGSTGIDEWVPDPENYNCGCSKGGKAKRYSKAVNAYKNAYAALSENYDIVLSGYIWNQGEADEEYDDPATVTVHDDQSYYDAYMSMHNGFMTELDLDFGGISVVRADRAGDTKEASSSYTRARAAQYRLCNEVENLYMISTFSETCTRDMMDQGNSVHYSQKVFNEMGVDMANNLYSRLGYGTTNAYAGIKILSKDGYTITDIDANGELVSGSNVITADSTAGRIIVKNSALGRDDTISCKITVNGIDCSKYINAFGVIDWEALEAETGMTSLKVIVNVK